MSRNNSESIDSLDEPFVDVRWTTCSIKDFRKVYWDEIAPRLRADGYDSDEHRPSHQWFRDNGLRAFLAALRRHHDRTFSEFWSEDLGLGDGDDGYDWATTDEDTLAALETFLENRRDRHSLTDASIEAKRRRLNLYVRAYMAANDSDDLLSPVHRESDIPVYEAVDACYAAFDWLNEQEYAARTKNRVQRVVDDWYQHLVGRRIAAANPATGLFDEFKWSVEDSDPASLDAEHVRSLAMTADSTCEQLLVVALAGWGLRANEVASLHVSQIVRDVSDDEVPYIQFDERKNGPGEVSILFGVEVLDSRLDDLVDDDDWTGYLFPSQQSATGHVGRERVWAWFRDLADRAGFPDEIDGEQPSPQLCRRFWYETYSSVLDAVLDGVEEIASEQGSSDPTVVMENYLSDERARHSRREFMRDRLITTFNIQNI